MQAETASVKEGRFQDVDINAASIFSTSLWWRDCIENMFVFPLP